MNIKKYKDFSINEASVTEDEKYDIEQIVAEITQDMGFELELSKVFYSDNKTQWHENFDTQCQNPVLRIHLTKKKAVLDESTIEKLLPSVHECVDRLSELGEAELMKFSLSRPYVNKDTLIDILIMVTIDEKPEISDLPGFYDFANQLSSRWRGLNNKVTRSFSVGDKDKESILLNNTIPGGATFTEVKAGVRRMLNPWPNRGGREYIFDFQKEGENVRITYKGYHNLNRFGHREA
jgi:hypothetical protein